LSVFILTSHSAAAWLALTLPVGWASRVGMAAVVCLSAGWSALVHLWGHTPWSVRAAVMGEGDWELTLGSGAIRSARLMPSTFSGRGLITLSFRCEDGQRLSMVVLPDAVDATTWRRLRVRLGLLSAKDAL
jgi:hypothetical protein